MKPNSLNVVLVKRKVAITEQRNPLTRLATNSSRAIRVAFGRLAALRQVARSGHEAKHRATVLDPKAAQLPKYRAILRQASLSSYIAFTDRAKAGAFERYLKSGSGHAFARKHLWKCPPKLQRRTVNQSLAASTSSRVNWWPVWK